MPKTMASKGGQPKNMMRKGGITKKMSLSLVVTAPVIMQTSMVIHPTATLPNQLFRYKIQPGECQLFFGLCSSILKRLND